MAAWTRKGAFNRDSSSQLNRYFYLNGKLHHIITIVRPADMAYTWSYPDRQRVSYIWSDLKRRMEPALTTQEVSKLMGRHKININQAITRGDVPPPQKIYPLDGTYRPGRYMWSEKDVMNLHDYFLTKHIGRPRKDGIIQPKAGPTKAEVAAMIRNNTILYVKNEKGEFIPVWKEKSW